MRKLHLYGTRESMSDASELLKELRIERNQPIAEPARRWPWIAAALVVLAVVGGAWQALQPKPKQVRTAQVQAVNGETAMQAASVLDATGYVTARRLATVSAKITGKVADIYIEEGQQVAEGEILARLESTDADAQRALAQAQFDAAKTQVAQAQAQLELAKTTLQRQRELHAKNLGSRAALDQAQAEFDALTAALAYAHRNVDVAQASLALAEIGVDNTIVRAPFAGVITVKAAQPGEIVSPISAGGGFTRTGIGTVVDMDSLEIQVDINESYIGRVKSGQQVEAVLNAYPDWKIPAEVIAIIPTADRSKATVKVRIAFLQKDARIVPDMGVRVSFLAPVEETAATTATVGVAAPAEAIVPRNGKTIAFVVRDGHVKAREVQAEPARNGLRRIAKGLVPGETVVLAPPPDLSDGDAVSAH